MFFHIKNDRITEMLLYTDTLGLMQQLGVVMPMEGT
jgi:hypothetical protein